MIVVIGWFCLIIAVLQQVALLYTANNDNNDSWKLRRSFIWISNPLFLIAAVLCFR